MEEISRKSRLIPLDPNAFGTSTLFPYTIDFPMPRGVKPPRNTVRPTEVNPSAQPTEATQSAEEPDALT